MALKCGAERERAELGRVPAWRPIQPVLATLCCDVVGHCLLSNYHRARQIAMNICAIGSKASSSISAWSARLDPPSIGSPGGISSTCSWTESSQPDNRACWHMTADCVLGYMRSYRSASKGVGPQVGPKLKSYGSG
jgi:hypothetical protein